MNADKWSCETCGKEFSRKGDLTRHQLIHVGYRPHKCVECGKSFSQLSGLKTHRNVHTKEKPYKCNINACRASFGDPSSCTRHRKETHRCTGAYRCPFPKCKSSIKRRSAFTAHMKKHGIFHLTPEEIDAMSSAPVKRGESMLADGMYRLEPLDGPHLSGSNEDAPSNVQSLLFKREDIQSVSGIVAASSASSSSSEYIDNEALFFLQSASPSFTPPVLSYSLSPSPAMSIRNDAIRTPQDAFPTRPPASTGQTTLMPPTYSYGWKGEEWLY